MTSSYSRSRFACWLSALSIVGISANSFAESSSPAADSQSEVCAGTIFCDEFNELNEEFWLADVGGWGWGNREHQYYNGTKNIHFIYDPEIQSNVMEMRAEVVNNETNAEKLDCWYGPCKYTSAKITTRGKYDFTYGRVEARLKLPQTQGIWPAFWLLGDYSKKPWPFCGEIDIMEHVGSRPNKSHGAIHGPGYSGANVVITGTHEFDHQVDQHYHIYAVEWREDSIKWMVDGKIFRETDRKEVENYGEWVFSDPFFILLNVAVGGAWPRYPDHTSGFPQSMYVDFVRIYPLD